MCVYTCTSTGVSVWGWQQWCRVSVWPPAYTFYIRLLSPRAMAECLHSPAMGCGHDHRHTIISHEITTRWFNYMINEIKASLTRIKGAESKPQQIRTIQTHYSPPNTAHVAFIKLVWAHKVCLIPCTTGFNSASCIISYIHWWVNKSSGWIAPDQTQFTSIHNILSKHQTVWDERHAE